MDIFKDLKDIEKIYENLINNAKEINLKDIETFREEQNKKLEILLSKKNDLVNNALGYLAKDVDDKTAFFEDRMDQAIKTIEIQFQKSIENLRKIIIEEVGLDF